LHILFYVHYIFNVSLLLLFKLIFRIAKHKQFLKTQILDLIFQQHI